MADQSFDPDANIGHRDPSPALQSLKLAIAKREKGLRLRFVHPRRDNLWVNKTREEYVLDLRKGAESLRLAPNAVVQLAELVGINSSLWTTIQSLSEDEDTRLLNKLLWHHGREPTFVIRLTVRTDTVVRITRRTYIPVHLPRLIDELEWAERGGILRLLRYELRPSSIRLVMEATDHESATSDRDGYNLEAKPSVLVFNSENQSRAAIVLPVISFAGGTIALPLVTNDSAVRRLAHRGQSPSQLAKDIAAEARRCARSSPYGRALAEITRLKRAPCGHDVLRKLLRNSSLARMGRGFRDRALSAFSAAGAHPTCFHALEALLRACQGLSPLQRLHCEIAIGRLVWQRGGLEL